jgi:hypothetical protein
MYEQLLVRVFVQVETQLYAIAFKRHLHLFNTSLFVEIKLENHSVQDFREQMSMTGN